MKVEIPASPSLNISAETKFCSKCNQYLDKSNFSTASGGKYLRHECRQCANKFAKERRDLQKIHGYPDDNYVCPICLRDKEDILKAGAEKRVWVIDHDHITKKFRGHLCQNCNRGIGVFRDDPEVFKRILNYLEDTL